MGRLWREQGKLQVFYLYKILARLETAFLFATIAVILSFPLSGLYFLAEKTGSSVYILDAWLLALNNTYTHLYLTAAFLFSISRMPRYGASVLFPSLRCSRGVAYMAPLYASMLQAVFVALGTALLSILLSAPIGYAQNEWSYPIQLLQNFNIRLKYEVSFTLPNFLMESLQPWQAFGYTLVQLVLFWTFLAQLVFFFSAKGRRNLGWLAAALVLLGGWAILLFAAAPELEVFSPLHHALPNCLYIRPRMDYTLLGMLIYLFAIDVAILILNWEQRDFGLENIITQAS